MQGRHFLIENPAGSEFVHLPCMVRIWNIGQIASCNVLQCNLGLIADGMPINKNTILWASSRLLLEPFRGLVCTCRELGTLKGKLGNIAKAKYAQVWPRNMCLRICIGIQAFIRSIRRNHLVYEESVSQLYPAALGLPRRRGRPRINPDGIADTVRGVIYDCFACIGRLHKRHPDHTRNDEPP